MFTILLTLPFCLGVRRALQPFMFSAFSCLQCEHCGWKPSPSIHINPTSYLSFVLLVTAALVHGLYDNCLNWDGQLSSGVLLKEKC